MMIWVKLFWWMVWQALLSGAATGALYGTAMALIFGAVFGLVYGAILGLITGIVNGLALTIMTRIWFASPQNSPRFRKAAIALVVICTALTSLVVTNVLFFGLSLFTYLPTII